MDFEQRLYGYKGDVAIMRISYGNTSLIADHTKYQVANKGKKSSGDEGFGTKLMNGEYYIHVARDENVRNYPTFAEVDKIPSKYALKDGKELGRIWRTPGIEYRFFHAAESTDDEPVVVARGVDEHGKLFEEKINVKQINPYNTTHLEIDALSYFKPGEYKTIMIPSGSVDLGLQDRFDLITEYWKDIRACNRLRLIKEAAWLKEDMDFLLDFTKGGTGSNKIDSAYTVREDSQAGFVEENKKNLELYSSAIRERLISSMARKCSKELSDMLWEN